MATDPNTIDSSLSVNNDTNQEDTNTTQPTAPSTTDQSQTEPKTIEPPQNIAFRGFGSEQFRSTLDTTGDIKAASEAAATAQDKTSPVFQVKKEQRSKEDLYKKYGYNPEDYEFDPEKYGFEVDASGDFVYPELDLSEAKDELERQAMVNMDKIKRDSLGRVQGQIGKINQLMSQQKMSGDGLEKSFFRSALRDVNQTAATANVNIMNTLSNSIANMLQTESLTNLQTRLGLDAERRGLISSLEAERRDILPSIMQREIEEELRNTEFALNSSMSIANSIDDPAERTEYLKSLSIMFPENDFFRRIAEDESYADFVTNSGYTAGFQSQWTAAAADTLANIDWNDNTSIDAGRVAFYDQIVKAKGGEDGILEELFGLYNSGNLSQETIDAVFGGQVPPEGMNVEDMVAYTDDYKEHLFQSGREDQEKNSRENVILESFSDYATDSPTERALMEGMADIFSNTGEMPNSMSFDIDGDRVILKGLDGGEITDPMTVPILQVFFEDWDGTQYSDEEGYNMKDQDRDPDFVLLDKMWIEYNNALPQGSKGISREQFKEEFYNDKTLTFGSRTLISNGVRNVNKNGQTPKQLAQGITPGVTQAGTEFDKAIQNLSNYSSEPIIQKFKEDVGKFDWTGVTGDKGDLYRFPETKEAFEYINSKFGPTQVRDIYNTYTTNTSEGQKQLDNLARTLDQDQIQVINSNTLTIANSRGFSHNEIINSNNYGIKPGEWFIYVNPETGSASLATITGADEGSKLDIGKGVNRRRNVMFIRTIDGQLINVKSSQRKP
jgi:hypothetical protein